MQQDQSEHKTPARAAASDIWHQIKKTVDEHEEWTQWEYEFIRKWDKVSYRTLTVPMRNVVDKLIKKYERFEAKSAARPLPRGGAP